MKSDLQCIFQYEYIMDISMTNYNRLQFGEIGQFFPFPITQKTTNTELLLPRIQFFFIGVQINCKLFLRNCYF